MENHVHSSLVCAARLLRLAGLNSEAVEDFSRKAVIDRFTMATYKIIAALFISIFTCHGSSLQRQKAVIK